MSSFITRVVEYIWQEIKISEIFIDDLQLMEIQLEEMCEELECSEDSVISRIDDILDEFKMQYLDSISDIQFDTNKIMIEL